MRTLETGKEIKIGMEIEFSDLWDGNGDGEQLLKDCSVCVGEDENDMPVIVGFEVVERAEDILEAVVKITDIY